MQQTDWVGDKSPRAFKDIRNTRESSASEKARLCLELGELCKKIPGAIKSGGTVNKVREWKSDQAAAMKIAGNARASEHELRSAITNMRRWFA